MKAKTFLRGNLAIWNEKFKEWFFEDGSKAIDKECPKCGKMQTKEGHDHCISNLPGVKYACCGHGKKMGGKSTGYISFIDGTVIRFDLISVERK